MRAMTRIRASILVVAGAVASASFAAPASRQAALVVSVTGKPAGVARMTYVETGKVIELGQHDGIVLGYLKSCVQETITGGTVTVGSDQSEVQSGKVARTKVACDPGKTDNEREGAGGVVVRGAIPIDPTPALTLYGTAPMVELNGPGTLQIERVGQPGERYSVSVTDEQLLNGRFYDFAKAGKNLSAGGVYSMKAGAEEIVFKIDPHAKPGATPILGRLLRFRSG
jgi:hypothetical protein